jgi:hypothetical protein
MNLIQLRVKKNAAYGKPSEWSKTHTPSCKHESGWTYVMEVEDEVNVDDIPDEAYDRVDGWARRNSFYIGNKALAKLSFSKAQICVGDVINCHPTCHTITKEQLGNYNCQNANSAGYHGTYKNTLAQLAGVCLTPGAPHSSAQKILQCPGSSSDKDVCFNMEYYRGNSFMSPGRGSAPYGVYYHWSGDHREWHTWGCGISYSPEGLLPHNGGHKYEWGMYQSPGSSCAPRTHMNLIQLRVQ